MTGTASALAVERTTALVAVTLSGGRRQGARLVSGERAAFGMNQGRSVVEVPYPAPVLDWGTRTVTCGVALQCAPSKDAVAGFDLHQLTSRQTQALRITEGSVALGWVAEQWPGLLPECTLHLPELEPAAADTPAEEILDRAMVLARSRTALGEYPLLGRLTPATPAPRGLAAAARRMRGRMPWGSKQTHLRVGYSIPVAGEGGVRNPNLPPPSRPDDDEELEIRDDHRQGIPYPEWNAWTQRFLPRYVAVLERKVPAQSQRYRPASADIRRYFQEQTHRVHKNGLDDGCELDIDRYVDHYVDSLTGHSSDGRVFRDLLPGYRDVTTALLLDGSSSLGVGQGKLFKLELACADALSHAMKMARERHGVFVFSGNTRHRVEVRCLKDFDEPRLVVPSGFGLTTGGYTRLGAPLRHLSSRLLHQPSSRRLLIVIGDGLMSDEGYEGRYAWADVAHAVEEAEDAGISIYYIGVGPVRVDPLPEVFGSRKSRRIRRIEELPNVLASVHRELVAA
ncbi:VWA domain-containing protein [Mycolicibacterium boenickei]